MLTISHRVSIPLSEIEVQAIRAQGAGGQNVNKVSSAVHLRFDVHASSLPEDLKARLLSRQDHRITKTGVVIIKAQRFRSQDKNREDAYRRLTALIRSVMAIPKKRRATRPSRASRNRRMDTKVRRGRIKAMRRKVVSH